MTRRIERQFAGNPDIIAALTSQDLLSWHRQFITPENMVIALVGDISEEEAVALWERWEAGCRVLGNHFSRRWAGT